MDSLSRKLENVYKSVLFARHDPDGCVFYFSHNDFEGLIKEPFDFKSQKGYLLKGGFYHYGSPRQDRLIVFDHGLGNGHCAYMREVEILCRAGYLVYTYDHTGCGASEGECIQGLAGSLADLDDCIRMIKRQSRLSGMEISVVGHSWGGYSALNILGYHHDIHSVVSISPFVAVSAIHKQLIPITMFPLRRRLMEVEREANPNYADSSAFDVLNKSNKPVLIIHSLDDTTISAHRNILRLRKETCERTNLEFIIQNGKGHSVHYAKEAAEYKRSFNREMKRLKKQGKLETDEQKATLIASYDWKKMTDQDEELWEKIFAFLDK